ncbi:hypothetical protein HA402_010990 [Bradysia odoriphaga]|nr:hypothetical protein HA402_010990 [Bradysia odoriphaga]
MLLVLLILIATSVVYGQTETECPNFSTFTSINGLQQNLNGTFLIVYTSGAVIKCERIKYTIDVNGFTTGYVESPNCCLKLDSFNFHSNELSYSISPAPGYSMSGCAVPLSGTLNGTMKLLASTGTGSSQCLITVVCHSGGYTAFYILCRQKTLPLPLSLYLLLNNVLELLGLTTINDLKAVDQTDCLFPTNNCPA